MALKDLIAVKRVVLVALIVLALIVTAAVVAKAIMPSDFIVEKATRALSKQTGFALRVESPPSFSLWPRPALIIEGATLTNPSFPSKPMMRTQRVIMELSLFDLLSFHVKISALTVKNPQIDFTVDEEGRSNWRFASTHTKTGAPYPAESPPPLQNSARDSAAGGESVAPTRIIDGRIHYFDARSHTVFDAAKVNMIITPHGLYGPLDVEGELEWNGEIVGIMAYVEHPMALAGGGTSPLDLSLNSRLVQLSYGGLVSLSGGPNLAGEIDIDAPSLRNFAEWVAMPVPFAQALRTFRLGGDVELQDQIITFTDTTLLLDTMRATGDIRIEPGDERPKVTASLGLDRIDLSPAKFRITHSDSVGPSDGAQTAAMAPGWSTRPIDLTGLKGVDADLTLVASHMIYGRIETGKTMFKATIDNGVLQADFSEIALYGGQSAGRLVLDASHDAARIRAGFIAKGCDGHELLRDVTGFTWLDGTATVSLSLAAIGHSQSELVSSITGKAGFTVTNGHIRSLDMTRMLRTVSQDILSGWGARPDLSTAMTIMQAHFTLDHGRAANDDFYFMGPAIQVTGRGVVDLSERSLDYRVESKPIDSGKQSNGQMTIKVADVPIMIRGTWTSPLIYPDIAGILQDPRAAYEALENRLDGHAVSPSGRQKRDAGSSIDEDSRRRLNEILKSLFDSGASHAAH